MVNARIRKNYAQKKLDIFSIGLPEDQTYKINFLGDNLSILRDILNEKNSFFEKLAKARKPMFIIGESVLNSLQGQFVIETSKLILKKYNQLNALNILHQSASSVGAIMIGAYNLIENVVQNEILYLLGADEINIDKKNKFIIYQGSHASKNAKIADVILPGAAFTEKDGLYINLEGRVQSAYRASYPPGNAKEDWKILRALSETLNKTLKFNTIEELRIKLFESFPSLSKIDELPIIDYSNLDISEKKLDLDSVVHYQYLDYYQSNEIARSSATMMECKIAREKLKKTGTDD